MNNVGSTRIHNSKTQHRWFGSIGAKSKIIEFRLLLIVLITALLILSCVEGVDAFSCQTITSSRSLSIKISSLNSSTIGQEKDGSTTVGAKIRAAVYQPPIVVPNGDVALTTENPLAVMTTVADVLQLASRCSIDVVQFPELFLNGGLLQNVLSGRSTPMDRESYVLNIIGNLCADLNIACVVGYAEAKHESESLAGGGCYNSLAIFHADGSRAGNYRCIHPSDPSANNGADITFESGQPLVEAMPISLRLPAREPEPTLEESITIQQNKISNVTTVLTREVKLGAMCGGDILVPEQARYLANSGADIFAVSGSLFEKDQIRNSQSKVAQHIVPTRCIENNLPLLFSNYVNNEDHDDHQNEIDENEPSFVGQSAIVSSHGVELVRAPKSLHADMPSDEGYFLPCETGGALYAADLDICTNINKDRIGKASTAFEKWNISPRIDDLGKDENGKKGGKKKKGFQTGKHMKTNGFGSEVVEVLEQNKNKELRLKN